MKSRWIFLLSSCISSIIAFGQPELIAETLNRWEKNFALPNPFSVEITVKVKSSIAEDTTIMVYQCFYNTETSELLIENPRLNLLETKSASFRLFPEKYTSLVIQDKIPFQIQDIFHAFFIKEEDFFKSLNRKRFSLASDSANIYMNTKFTTYVLGKENYKLIRIDERKHDKVNGGDYIKQIIFHPNDISAEIIIQRIEKAKRIIEFGSVEKPIEQSDINPQKFDRDLLLDSFQVLNGPIGDLKGKLILLDFFYQSCLPCVKSIPQVSELFSKGAGKIVVISIDPVLHDTLNMAAFLERYNIQHPVIIGEMAIKLKKALNARIWPTFVLVDSNGTILKYQQGYSRRFFTRISKRYL